MDNKSQLLEVMDDWENINTAIGCLVLLLAGCSDNDAPPPRMLWTLLSAVEKNSRHAQDKLKQNMQ